MSLPQRMSRGSRPLRSHPLFVLVAVLLLAAAYFLVPRLLDRGDPERSFQSALEGLERGDPAAYRAAVPVLERQRGYEDHLSLLDGLLLLRSGRPEEALLRLKSVRRDGPLRREALRYSGEALYRLQRLAEAEAVLRTVTTRWPDDVDAHRWLAATYYDLGAYHFAIPELEQVIALDPADYRPHRLIGLMYRDFDKFGEAVPYYRRALELSPPPDVEQEIRRELAECLMGTLEYEEALEVLRETEPDALSEALAARCELTLGRRDAAEEHLARAQALDSADLAVLLLEAELELSDGEADKAVAILQEAARLYPFDPECRYRLAMALQAAKRNSESEAELARWNTLMDLSRRLTDLNEAALGDVQNAEIRRELASVCEQLGKPELAKMWRDSAAAIESAGAQPR